MSCSGQLHGDLQSEYIYIETYTCLISYLAQSRPTWHRADLPGTEPTYLAQSRPTRQRTGSSCLIELYSWLTARQLADVKLALEAAS